MIALVLAGCASQPSLAGLKGVCVGREPRTPEEVAWLKQGEETNRRENLERDAAGKAEREQYERAQAATVDGGRLYRFSWSRDRGRFRHALTLEVSPSGQGVLLGAKGSPVVVDPKDVAIIETAVDSVGAVGFARATDNLICTHPVWGSFDAARNGVGQTAYASDCGLFQAGISEAREFLMELAEAHGGPVVEEEPLQTIAMLFDCPD
ncbi:hypothetical protein [Caulobacter sp. NIBR1757]|uniref:hypothetical protein n=1 Tax=Caulobacter sp. NIBR1757 TaxID=3016000 RepID=UPI0022EFF939|nr:hypothetical protein [Caulobacter sp. NIBR1757]